jgi:hypothetical protein
MKEIMLLHAQYLTAYFMTQQNSTVQPSLAGFGT